MRKKIFISLIFTFCSIYTIGQTIKLGSILDSLYFENTQTNSKSKLVLVLDDTNRHLIDTNNYYSEKFVLFIYKDIQDLLKQLSIDKTLFLISISFDSVSKEKIRMFLTFSIINSNSFNNTDESISALYDKKLLIFNRDSLRRRWKLSMIQQLDYL